MATEMGPKGDSDRSTSARSRSLRRVLSYTPPVLIIGVLLVVWQLAVSYNDIAPAVLPTPGRVARTFFNERALFAENMGVTLLEMAYGLLSGFAAGVVAAIGIVHSRFFERTFYPIIVTSQMIPFVALAPLLVIWLGFGIAPKVIIVAIGVFFPVTVNMVAGLRSVDPDVVRLMRSYSASKLQIFRMVELPASLPYLHTALQIAATYSVITAVVAEWPGAQKGLGRVMITSNSLSRTDIVLAAVLLVTVLSLVVYGLAKGSRRFLTPWERASRSL